MNLKIFRYITLSVVLTAALMLLSACSNSDDAPTAPATPAETAPQEVLFNANVHRMLDGTRATTYNDVASLRTEGSFTCMAYNADSDPLVTYIPSTTVNWDSGETRWEFNGGASHYYWPLPATNGGAWPSLDFFGYMPATPPSYITAGPTYSANHNVTFTCSSLPMTYNSETPTTGQGSSLKEFMFGMALGQNYGNAAAGVPLTFQHPFALIKFTITAASGTHVQVNSVSIPALYTGATCTYNGSTMSWGSYDEESKAAMTVTQTLEIGGTTQSTPFIVIPKNYGSKALTVNCTWDDWSAVTKNLSADVSFDWEPGYIYTYNLTVTKYALKVETEETFTEQW